MAGTTSKHSAAGAKTSAKASVSKSKKAVAPASINKVHHKSTNSSNRTKGDQVQGEAGEVDDDEPDLDLNDLLAMKENYELDLASHLRTIRLERETALNTLERHWKTGRHTLAEQLVDLSMRDFANLYQMDENLALAAIVSNGMEVAPMGEAEKNFRNLKRAAPASPAHHSKVDAKKARPDTAPVSIKKKVPSSTSRPGTSRGAAASRSRTIDRSPATAVRCPAFLMHGGNYRPDPIQPQRSASSAGFVYLKNRPSIVFNQHLPPTPSVGATGRRPRRGESIILQSVNGSPLGEFLADDVASDEEEEEQEEETLEQGDGRAKKDVFDAGDETGWDLMEKFEASRAEDNGKGKKGKGSKGKIVTSASTSKSTSAPAPPRRSSRSRSSSLTHSTAPVLTAPISTATAPSTISNPSSFAPPSAKFTYEGPSDVEKKLKVAWQNQLKTMLETTKMSDEDKERLRKKYEILAEMEI